MFLLEKYLCFLGSYTRVPIPSRSQRETRNPNCLILSTLTIFFSSFTSPHFSALNGFYIVRLYVVYIVIIQTFFIYFVGGKVHTLFRLFASFYAQFWPILCIILSICSIFLSLIFLVFIRVSAFLPKLFLLLC